MATYQVETDNGTYEVETSEPTSESGGGFELLSNAGGETGEGKVNEPMADYWKGKGAYPDPGAEKPVEQRLAENTLAVGNGLMLPEGVAGAANLASSLVKTPLNTVGNAAETAAKYAGRFGENQAIKALGARMGQIGSAGIPESRAIAREMVERGIIRPFRGPIGLEEEVQGLHGAAGENIGAARAMADARNEAAGGAEAPGKEALYNLAKSKFEPSYQSGHLSGRAGTFNKTLETLKNPVVEEGQMTGPEMGTFQGNAAKATELNSAGTPDKALSQSKESPYSDVANMVSHENNAAMGKVLTPEEMAQHRNDLSDYGMFDKVKKFMESGEKKEMGGRGAGSISKTVYDKTMDTFGNRASAVAGFGAESALKTVAKMAGSPTEGIVNLIKSAPQTLGKFAVPLTQAYQTGGNQGVAAMHYVLSTTHPEYNQLTLEHQ